MNKQKITSYLADGLWHTASDIKDATLVSTRRIRRIAERSDTIISGQRGYKLISKATQPELERQKLSLLSRARKLINRVNRLENYSNNKVQNNG